MKVTKVHIKDFHQFQDLYINLTYPKGHKKAGKPLDKVCIIGQSGTGKTTLLKIIGGYTYTLKKLFEEFSPSELKNTRVFRKLNDIEMEIKVTYNEEDSRNAYTWVEQTLGGEDVQFENVVNLYKQQRDEIRTQFIYFPADLRYEWSEGQGNNLLTKKVIDFRKDNINDVWEIILADIQKHQEIELGLRQEIGKVAEESDDLKKIQKAVRKLETWKRQEFNPVNAIADKCLDPLLKHFGLKVKRELNFEKKEDIGSIHIEDFLGNEIPYSLWSTGTKQVVLSAMPLYLLEPKETLILYDEPERSLYPNMQRLVIDYYTSLTKNCQFFFATHSPIIASSFEPWEIVELKLGNDGFVYQDLYYPKDKERHVDNYTIIPSYLDYDLMLTKVFDLKETHSHVRSEKITEVLALRNQLKKLASQNKQKTPNGKKLYESYKKLAEQLAWDFDII